MKINEIAENISHTSKRIHDIEREKNVEPGTPEWFKLWFSLPYLKEALDNTYPHNLIGINEGYKLQLERDTDMMVLNITDTATGKRTEVRGKAGYETNGYDPDDKLHQLLDKVGRSANVSELMNGEVVTINPKHPQGASAKTATTTAFNESLSSMNEENGKEMLQIFRGMHHDADMNKNMDRYIQSHDWKLGDFTPDMFPSEEEFFDYDDPFDRIIDIDYSHRVNLSQPIIVGPQFSDGKYSVIDGNHRAASAQKMGKTIQAYFPVSTTAFNESLDNPYPYKFTGPNTDNTYFAKAQTPNGELVMEFDGGYDDFSIDFAIGNEMGKTDAGDQFRVFATVVAMMNKWISVVGIEHVEAFDFAANKEEHASDGRARLYSRFAKKLAAQLGWSLQQSSTKNDSMAFFSLQNPKPMPRPDGYFDALEDGKLGPNGEVPTEYTESVTEAEDTLTLPKISVGDEVMVGKFKNRKAEVKGFSKDDHNQPVLKTTKGDQKLFKPRLSKLMKEL